MNVSRLPIGNAPQRPESDPEYLTFTNVHESETAHISMNTDPTERGVPHEPVIFWSKTTDNFVRWDYSAIELLSGESVYMYGYNPYGVNYYNWEEKLLVAQFVIADGSVAASGNIQSLLTISARSANPLPEEAGSYYGLFQACFALISAPKLPAKELDKHCYGAMFYQCINLTIPPELPATTLAEYCYTGMFFGCSRLTTAPELPATILATACYFSMFQGCFMLTTAPKLPATTLADGCYMSMFDHCSALSDLEVSFTNWGQDEDTSTRDWLSAVSAAGTFTKPAALPEERGSGRIPEGWTVINKD